jgi:hypothetical protein
MTLKERCELARQGKYILRVQLRADRTYHVAYQTTKGGWAILDKMYITAFKEKCQRFVDQLVESDPEKYMEDPDLL